MKSKIIFLLLILISTSVMARIVQTFPGWDELKRQCPDIFIVQCGSPAPPAPPNVHIMDAYASYSEISIISVLKGTNNVKTGLLQTDYELVPNRFYLVYIYDNSGPFTSFGKSGVVPLGRWFTTTEITGKPLDEQLQILLQEGLKNVNEQIADAQEEKQQLEEGLPKK